MKAENLRGISIFWCSLAKDLLLSEVRLVGKTVAHPSTLDCGKGPPQAVENRKIIGVLIRFKIALFSAGNELAKMGNTLGQFRHLV